MAGVVRHLWVIQYQWDGESRIWWAYFKDWSELQACLAIIMGEHPRFELLRLEACPDGLRVLGKYYSATYSSREYADDMFKELFHERNGQFFPLAPYASGYLTSFRVGLGW